MSRTTSNTNHQLMKKTNILHRWLLLTLAALLTGAQAAPVPAKGKLEVFILVGQSNMEGHAKVETFDYIGDDPATAPLLKQMRGADGKPRVCDNVWISYFTGLGEANGEGFGKLTAGYGSRQKPDKDGGKIGPEFTFGLTMDAALDEPVLIIKTAWGGKSLHTDFRPPSAGPYVPSAEELKHWQANLSGQSRGKRKVSALGFLCGFAQVVERRAEVRKVFDLKRFNFVQGVAVGRHGAPPPRQQGDFGLQ